MANQLSQSRILKQRGIVRLCLWMMTALFVLQFAVHPVETQAAASYRSLSDVFYGSESGAIKKIGSFWFMDQGGYLYYSSRRSGSVSNGTYRYAGTVSGAYTNGSKILTISYDGYLKQITCKSGAEKKLKKLPGYQRTGEGDSWRISAIYGNRVYLTRSSFNKWKQWTYLYNLKTKSFKKVKTNCKVTAQKGKYLVAEKEFRTDVSPVQLTVYKSTASGLKKLKKLANRSMGAEIVGKKIYYTVYSGTNMKKCTLYRCNLNGKGRKKLCSFQASGTYGQVMISEITAKNCKVWIHNENSNSSFRYTYSTGKRTAI